MTYGGQSQDAEAQPVGMQAEMAGEDGDAKSQVASRPRSGSHSESRASADMYDSGQEDDQAQRCMASFQIWCNPDHPTIAAELRGMSRERRELVWVDLSGNRKGSMYYQELDPKLKETPENIQRAMEELDAEIQRAPTFTLLRKVQQQNPEYINSPDFRMQFLRCDRFNVKDATARMMRYFEEKRKIWGEHCLGRDISITDLDEEDLACLTMGGHTMLPNLESSGRRIYLTNRAALNYAKAKSIIRANWYLIMKTIKEDETVQKMGVVRLSYLLNYTPAANTALSEVSVYRGQLQLAQALPIRFAAIYIVSQPRVWDAPINSTLKLLNTALVVRTRLLSGSYQECIYQLACLGITSLPIGEDGSMDMSDHLAWIQACQDTQGSRKRQKKESEMHDDE